MKITNVKQREPVECDWQRSEPDIVVPDLYARGIGFPTPIQTGQFKQYADERMDRVPILNMEKIESLTKNLSLVIGLNSKTLPCINAPTQTLLQLTQDGFDHS